MAQPRTHGQCPTCRHYGSDCKCHLRAELSADDIRVIRERHFGWEKAPAPMLARIFNVSRQRIVSVLKP